MATHVLVLCFGTVYAGMVLLCSDVSPICIGLEGNKTGKGLFINTFGKSSSDFFRIFYNIVYIVLLNIIRVMHFLCGLS